MSPGGHLACALLTLVDLLVHLFTHCQILTTTNYFASQLHRQKWVCQLIVVGHRRFSKIIMHTELGINGYILHYWCKLETDLVHLWFVLL